MKIFFMEDDYMQRYAFIAMVVLLMLVLIPSFSFAECMACHQDDASKENTMIKKSDQNSLKEKESTPLSIDE